MLPDKIQFPHWLLLINTNAYIGSIRRYVGNRKRMYLDY